MKIRNSLLVATLATSALLPIAAFAQDTAPEPAPAPSTMHSKLDAAGTATKDTATTALLKTKYAADSSLSALDIHIQTNHGVVKLTGSVDNKAQVELAGKIAKETDGVKKVHNKLQAKATS